MRVFKPFHRHIQNTITAGLLAMGAWLAGPEAMAFSGIIDLDVMDDTVRVVADGPVQYRLVPAGMNRWRVTFTDALMAEELHQALQSGQVRSSRIQLQWVEPDSVLVIGGNPRFEGASLAPPLMDKNKTVHSGPATETHAYSRQHVGAPERKAGLENSQAPYAKPARDDGHKLDFIAKKAMDLREKKQYAEAEPLYAQLSGYQPAKWLLPYAEVVYLNERSPRAIRTLEDLLGRARSVSDPTVEARLKFILGTLYQEQGNHDDALPYLISAATALQADETVQFNTGLALEQLGKPSEAFAYYDRAARLAPGKPAVQQAISRLQRYADVSRPLSRN